MAELNLRQISDKLNTEFQSSERKLIFWYDDNAEFADEIDQLVLENANIYKLEQDNQLYTKYFLEKKDTQTSYLLYAPFPKPDKRKNHLEDTLRYSKQFFVDRASLVCVDLGISDEYKEIIQKYVKFFSAQDRSKRFYDLGIDNYNQTTIETGLLSAVCKIKVNSIEECLRVILMENLEENKYLDEIEKFDLTEAFWRHIDNTFGYSDSQPTLEKLLMTMFITYTSRATQEELPSAWKPYLSHKPGSIMAFLDSYMNSSVYGDRFDELSGIIYKTINGHNNLANMPLERITDCFIFRGIDEILLHWLITRLETEDTAANLEGRTIPELCLLRRKQHFGNSFRNEYFVIENAYYIIKDAKYSPVSNVNEIVKSYTQSYYKIDMRYRYFYFYYDKLGDNCKFFEKVRNLIENIYTNEYLNKITSNWCSAFAEADGITNLVLQNRFYDHYVKNVKDKVCIIISDAFRYEVARTLLEKLESDEKCTSKMDIMQSVLPSVTQTGMAALLPHSEYALNTEYKAVVDGKICDDTKSREAQCQTFSANSKCVQFDNISGMSQEQLREIFTGQDFVYVYHNQIDARGDKAPTENEVFNACEEAVNEIFTLIKRLNSVANIYHFIVTADHGFLYKRDKVFESDKIDGVRKSADSLGKRYAMSGKMLEFDGIRSIKLNKFYSGREGYVSSPLGTDIIKAPGSGLNFVHGGCSPQEMIIPVIDIKTEKSKTETTKAKISVITPQKSFTNRIITLEFIQSEPVTDVIKEATYKVYFVDASGEAISNENFIIADRTDTEGIHRIFKHRFNLKDKVFTKSDKYYIVAVDEDNGMEVLRNEVIIDIAFAGNFGF